MRAKMLAFNEIPGSIQVYPGDGSTVFDSRYPTMRRHMTTMVSLAGAGTVIPPDGRILFTGGGVTVPYAKTFGRVPYVLSASRKLQLNTESTVLEPTERVYPPRIWYATAPTSDQAYSSLRGHYTSAGLSDVFVGNLASTGSSGSNVFRGNRIAWITVFENAVDFS